MKIALAQLDFKVGDFESNFKKIRESFLKGSKAGADCVLTPELAVCGYPPHDLLDRSEIMDRCEKVVQDLLPLTKGVQTALVVGYVSRNPYPRGRLPQNTVSVLRNGKIEFSQSKSLLPTYDVFDEARYFQPAEEIRLWEFHGKKIALAICEDLWASDPDLKRPIYDEDPVTQYQKLGADLVFALSASPYIKGKRQHREGIHAAVAKKLKAPIVYLNQVGANDEILFDGSSFGVSAEGKRTFSLPAFEEAIEIIELGDSGNPKPTTDNVKAEFESEDEVLFNGLVCGIRDYFQKNGFKEALLGLSGGIDSALVAVLAVRALGSQNVTGVAMPSQFSSTHSLEDAEALARNLGMPFEVRPIKFAYSMLSRELGERRGGLAPIALENLQSRIRGMILMTYANHDGALVLTTGNKSEIATGYCTLYGDMVGALAPLGDLLKTEVYALSQWINLKQTVIPERILTKAPSAELRPDQADQDTLPPYPELDAFLRDYLEEALPLADLIKKHPKARPLETVRRIEQNEYKRRQAAPVLKVSKKAFGIGRRIPITKTWDA